VEIAVLLTGQIYPRSNGEADGQAGLLNRVGNMDFAVVK